MSVSVHQWFLVLEQPGHRMMSSRWAALGAASVAVVLVCAVFVLPHYSGEIEALQYQPHLGPLTLMVDSQRASAFARRQGRTTDLAQMEHDLHRQRSASSGDASAWAQQLLDTDSDAESRTKPMSLSTRRYSNTHSGYTSDVPESKGNPEDNAYDFANLISHHSNEREMKAARYQQLAERDDDNRQAEQPKSIVTRGYSNSHVGYSSDVPESKEAPEDSAWDFATRISSHRHERENAIRHRATGARQQQLALVDDTYDGSSQSLRQSDRTAWQWATDNDVREASEDTQQKAAPTPRLYASPSFSGHKTAYSASKKPISGFTSAIPEDHDTAEGTAWDWAADQFAERHRIRESPVHYSSEQQAPQQKAQIKMPSEFDVRNDIKLVRQLKIAAARQAMGDLHESTQRTEDIDFARKVIICLDSNECFLMRFCFCLHYCGPWAGNARMLWVQTILLQLPISVRAHCCN
jgi:hypothetical protein